ncbi:TDT family transporter [Anaerotalea alkaliphila]|uniref:TDT family transporter n=1 Tax=Anaerotalea alkaliphila TaxID=2662126 RepID=A0A7X5HXG5_9FIRM|nr:TDT family transporter [Anaerotalea alkaliphila]NDL68457.1 TDT family transporter [Anaerotalea alkaliphila]
MRGLLKVMPFPMAGLLLGLAAAGNMLLPYGAAIRPAFGGAAFLLALLLGAKALTAPAELKAAYGQPPVAGVLPAFSMGLAVLATYVRPVLPGPALGLWGAALLLHIGLLAAFTWKHVAAFDIRKVFPSWFVVYVGVAVFAVTGPAFGQPGTARAAFWFGFGAYLVLMPVVLYRVVKVREVPAPVLPTMAIFAAPGSLLLAGYLAAFPGKNLGMAGFLAVCSAIGFLGVMAVMPRLLRQPFHPSVSAFTFPFVITAIAWKGAGAYLAQSHQGVGMLMLEPVLVFLQVWATAMVLQTLVRYALFLKKEAFPAPVPQEAEEQA